MPFNVCFSLMGVHHLVVGGQHDKQTESALMQSARVATGSEWKAKKQKQKPKQKEHVFLKDKFSQTQR